jgi:hypothetical protein
MEQFIAHWPALGVAAHCSENAQIVPGDPLPQN